MFFLILFDSQLLRSSLSVLHRVSLIWSGRVRPSVSLGSLSAAVRVRTGFYLSGVSSIFIERSVVNPDLTVSFSFTKSHFHLPPRLKLLITHQKPLFFKFSLFCRTNFNVGVKKRRIRASSRRSTKRNHFNFSLGRLGKIKKVGICTASVCHPVNLLLSPFVPFFMSSALPGRFLPTHKSQTQSSCLRREPSNHHQREIKSGRDI